MCNVSSVTQISHHSATVASDAGAPRDACSAVCHVHPQSPCISAGAAPTAGAVEAGRMILSIRDVARVASEAEEAASPSLTVTGVRVTGGSGYSEILVFNRRCQTEPCHSALGVFRDSSEAAPRAEITDTLRRHLQIRT